MQLCETLRSKDYISCKKASNLPNVSVGPRGGKPPLILLYSSLEWFYHSLLPLNVLLMQFFGNSRPTAAVVPLVERILRWQNRLLDTSLSYLRAWYLLDGIQEIISFNTKFPGNLIVVLSEYSL